MKNTLLSIIIAFLFIVVGCGDPDLPVIDSINPASGPGGTIVEVDFSGGQAGGVIIFDGVQVSTRNANSLGLQSKVRFTIPYSASLGNNNVQVRSGGKTSGPDSFNVTGSSIVPVPTVEDYTLGWGDGSEITVFGTGFSTFSEVFVDGVQVSSYIGSSLPFRDIPFNFVDNIIICQPATKLVLGSAHTLQVRNPNGNNSNILNIVVPNRVCKVEYDAIEGVPIPDYYVFRDNTINTFRRTYGNCGWIIEFQLGTTEITDPFPGIEWSFDDLYQFWQAEANVPPSGNYMHGMFISDGPVPRGIMFMNSNRVPSLPSANQRQGFACFWDDFSGFSDRMNKYFRTSLHEAGHGFHLYHNDQALSQTIMTTTNNLANGWHCFPSNVSCNHLMSHNITDVAPGGTAWGSRTCH